MGERSNLKHIKEAEYKKRGGATYLLVPPEVKEFLGLGESGEIIYLKDLDKKWVIIAKPEEGRIEFSNGETAQFFSVSDELADKILKKKIRN